MVVYQALMTLALLVFYPAAGLLAFFGKPAFLRRLTPPADLPEDAVPRIWIHAASMGESIIAFAVAKELRKRKPGCFIFVSTTTLTGLESIRNLAAPTGKRIIEHSFLAPFDHPWIAGRFVRRLRPTVFMLVETEIWPSLLTAVSRRKVPVVVVNGKLSSRAFRRYRVFRRTMRRIMDGLSLVCVQSRSFARRYRLLGVQPERIEILGNIKFDSLPDSTAFKPSVLRSTLGFPRDARLFVAGSTRPGEEEIIVRAFAGIIGQHPEAILVIAPRHLNRVPEVEKIVREAGLSFAKRSDGDKLSDTEHRVLLLDTMGELLATFACADTAFVGGSLRDFGGHNPMEPAALGVPVLFGPYMEQTGAKELLSGGAALLIHDEQDLAETVLDLWSHEDRRTRMGEAGRAVVGRFKGVLARTIQCMENRRIL